MLTPNGLTCEYVANPVGLDVRQPRLSWKADATQRGARQMAYHIRVGENPAALETLCGRRLALAGGGRL